jgi:hypothetical protein
VPTSTNPFDAAPVPGASPTPDDAALIAVAAEHDAFCRSKEYALGLQIAATILLALALLAWINKKPLVE